MEEADVHNLVKSVANKQQANKRKRDPDIYLDAVLECTVRRLNRERMERDEVARKRKRKEDETVPCAAAAVDSALSRHFSANTDSEMDCSRTMSTTMTNDIATTTLEHSDFECDQMDRHLDEELSGDLKELLDELAREFPGDFWLTDTNNNCSLSNCELDEPSEDLWLSSIIEVLCSS